MNRYIMAIDTGSGTDRTAIIVVRINNDNQIQIVESHLIRPPENYRDDPQHLQKWKQEWYDRISQVYTNVKILEAKDI